MEFFQCGVASRLLPEVAVHAQQRLARAQVGRNGITRLTELGGDSREKNTKFTLRHDAGGSISGQSADLMDRLSNGSTIIPYIHIIHV
jgi:hypothetical protein